MAETRKLGKYEIIRELGRGGFGVVYEAKDTILGRHVAIKILHGQLSVDPDFLERFEQEARLAAQLEHPNLVPVYDFGQLEGHNFISMGFMRGGSLKDRLIEHGPFDPYRAKKALEDMLEGLSIIHENRIVHRDLKPANILFDQYDVARLSDLGFAKALHSEQSRSFSASGGIVGTAAYMAPEVWRGAEASELSDIYSLGCIVYEMLTGIVLFDGNTAAESMTKHLIDGPVFTVDLPKPWQSLIEKCIAKDPAGRYQSAKAVLEDLRFGLFDAPQERQSEIVLESGDEGLKSAPDLKSDDLEEGLAWQLDKASVLESGRAYGKADDYYDAETQKRERNATERTHQKLREEKQSPIRNRLLIWLVIPLAVLFLITGTLYGIKKNNEKKAFVAAAQTLTHAPSDTPVPSQTPLPTDTPSPTTDTTTLDAFDRKLPTHTLTMTPTNTLSPMILAVNCKSTSVYDICFSNWITQGNHWLMTFKASEKVELNRLLMKINDAELTCSQMDDQRQFTCLGPSNPVNQDVPFEVFDKFSKKSLSKVYIRFYGPTPTSTLSLSKTPVAPSNTPVIPSNTPVIPSNTPVIPSNTPVTPTEPSNEGK